MKIVKLLQKLFVVVLCVFCASACRAECGPDAITKGIEMSKKYQTQKQLDALIAQLDDPKTRLFALSELVPFANWKLYQVGSILFMSGKPLEDELQKNARDAVVRYKDVTALRAMMQSDDTILQSWALYFWRGLSLGANSKLYPSRQMARNDASVKLETNEYATLLPIVRALAKNDDVDIRDRAVAGLSEYQYEKPFLQQRLRDETSIYVIATILYNSRKTEIFDEDVQPFLLKFLRDPNQNVRNEALGFLSSALSSYSIYSGIKFNDDILSEVMKLQQSHIKEEASFATYVLRDWRKRDEQNATSRTRHRVLDRLETCVVHLVRLNCYNKARNLERNFFL